MIPHVIQDAMEKAAWQDYVAVAISLLVILAWLIWVARSLLLHVTQ